jgi:hypothetical protein
MAPDQGDSGIYSFIQHMAASFLLWAKEGQLSEAGISAIREMSWGRCFKEGGGL